MKKIWSIVSAVIGVLVIALPVLASYTATINFHESAGTAYSMIGLIQPANVSSMASSGYIAASGNDTRVEVGGVAIPHMLADDKILFAQALPTNSSGTLQFTTGNSGADFHIIPGYGGYITTAGNTTLEHGDNFTDEWKGYLNTDNGTDKNLVSKMDATLGGIKTFVSPTVSQNITAQIRYIGTAGTAFPVVATTNSGFNAGAAGTNISINMPAGTVNGDLIIVILGTHATASYQTLAAPVGGGWTSLGARQASSGVGHYYVSEVWYKITAGGETSPQTWTSSQTVTHSYHTLRISVDSFMGVPAMSGTAGTASAPNPLTLTSGFGAVDTLWIAPVSSVVAQVSYPSNYNDGQAVVGTAPYLYTCRRSYTGATQDPGAYGTVTTAWTAFTIAVKGFGVVSVSATGVASGERTVTVGKSADSQLWASGPVAHFDGTANSNINCGAIYNAAGVFWTSFWFTLDAPWTPGMAAEKYLMAKYIDATHKMEVKLYNVTGRLEFNANDSIGGGATNCASTQTSWAANTPYHVFVSLNNVSGARLRINGGAAITDVDTDGLPNGDNLVIGAYHAATASGITGKIFNVIVGTGALTTTQETNLALGIAPTGGSAPTDYWYIDEGTGVAITSYGTAANPGTAGAAVTWGTSTYSGGSTGRLTNFYVSPDTGLRTGINTHTAVSVPNNANNWTWIQGNVMPSADYIKMTIGGTPQLWYQPNAIILGTVLPDRATATVNNGTFTWGSNPSGIMTSMAGFVYTGVSSAPSAGEQSQPNAIPSVNLPGMDRGDTELTGAGWVWMYPVIEIVHNDTGLPIVMIWGFLCFLFVLIAMVASFRWTQNMVIMSITMGACLALCAGMSLLPPWAMVIPVGIAVSLLILERQPGL